MKINIEIWVIILTLALTALLVVNVCQNAAMKDLRANSPSLNTVP